MEFMDFSDALKMLKSKKRVSRDFWKNIGVHIELQVPDAQSKMTMPYLYIVSKDGDKSPWLPGQLDLLSHDWILV